MSHSAPDHRRPDPAGPLVNLVLNLNLRLSQQQVCSVIIIWVFLSLQKKGF